MRESISHDTSINPPTSKEVRHDPGFITAVVGGRHEDPHATFRKGEVYDEPGSELQMSRFLRYSESGQSTGMLVTTRNDEGDKRRFYIMRGGPRGVIAGPKHISVTDVEKSIKDKEIMSTVHTQKMWRVTQLP